jgi:hypothetical protein
MLNAVLLDPLYWNLLMPLKRKWIFWNVFTRYEFLTAVFLKIQVFWVVALCFRVKTQKNLNLKFFVMWILLLILVSRVADIFEPDLFQPKAAKTRIYKNLSCWTKQKFL